MGLFAGQLCSCIGMLLIGIVCKKIDGLLNLSIYATLCVTTDNKHNP